MIRFLPLLLLATSCAGDCSAFGGSLRGGGAFGDESALMGGALTVPSPVVSSGCSSALPTTSLVTSWWAGDIDGSGNSTLTDNDPISTWVYNGATASAQNNMTQTGTARPTYNDNATDCGFPECVTFDGVDDYILTASVDRADYDVCHQAGVTCTAYIVWRSKVANPLTFYGLVGTSQGYNSVHGFRLALDDRAATPANDQQWLRVQKSTTLWDANSSDAASTITSYNISSFTWDDEAVGDDITNWVNGSSVASAEPTVAASATTAQVGLTVGVLPGALTNYANIDVYAVAVYSNVHGSTEYQAYEDWIECKSGQTIPYAP